MNLASVSWWSACGVSLVVHGVLLLRAVRSERPEPIQSGAPGEVLPVSLVGSAASIAEYAALAAALPVEQRDPAPGPGKHLVKPTHHAAPSISAAGAPGAASSADGSEGVERASAVPRAMIKAVVLMASHDGMWMQCARDDAHAGTVHIATDSQGHMQEHDAYSSSALLNVTLSRALTFLSSRSFSPRDAQLVLRVRARCFAGAPGAFEIGDSANAQQASGHVRFDNGRRVEFELSAQK